MIKNSFLSFITLILGLVFLLFIFTSLGCGKGINDTPIPPTPPSTRPTVESFAPGQGVVGVLVDAPVYAVFSKDMDPVSVTKEGVFAVFRGTFESSGTVIYDPALRKASFIHDNFISNSYYRVLISNEVKDLSGNTMCNLFGWSFTTASTGDVTGPKIVSVSPSEDAVGVLVIEPITVVFDEPMNENTLSSGSITLSSEAGDVSGVIFYDAATYTASFVHLPILYSTNYTAHVNNWIKDTSGNFLQHPKTWKFTTGPDTTAPYVSSTSPIDNTTGVPTTAVITATFSEDMDSSTISGDTFVVVSPSGEVSGTISYEASSKKATFTPQNLLDYDIMYKVTVSKEVQDLAGNPMSTSKNWTFYTSTEASQYWTEITSPVTSVLKSVNFIDSSNGWAAGGGKIIKTTDKGETWSQISDFVNVDITDCKFLNSNFGYIVGQGTMIHAAKTSDGGVTWSGESSFGDRYCLYSVSPEVCFVAGNSGTIYKTSNTGYSWDNIATLPNDINDITFSDNLNGYVVGFDGLFYKTSNGGSSWTSLNSGVTETLEALSFVSSLEGWIVGRNGKILHVLNGGSSVSSQTSGVSENLRGVYFITDSDGWVVGDGGVILHTQDKGANWELVDIGTTANLYDVFFIDAQSGFVVGDSGKIFKYLW